MLLPCTQIEHKRVSDGRPLPLFTPCLVQAIPCMGHVLTELIRNPSRTRGSRVLTCAEAVGPRQNHPCTRLPASRDPVHQAAPQSQTKTNITHRRNRTPAQVYPRGSQRTKMQHLSHSSATKAQPRMHVCRTNLHHAWVQRTNDPVAAVPWVSPAHKRATDGERGDQEGGTLRHFS